MLFHHTMMPYAACAAASVAVNCFTVVGVVFLEFLYWILVVNSLELIVSLASKFESSAFIQMISYITLVTHFRPFFCSCVMHSFFAVVHFVVCVKPQFSRYTTFNVYSTPMRPFSQSFLHQFSTLFFCYLFFISSFEVPYSMAKINVESFFNRQTAEIKPSFI